MLDDLPLPVKVNFSIKPKYAFLVGVTQIVYARFESTIVDIIGFHKKGFRHGYYLRDQLNPSDLLDDLEEIGSSEDRQKLDSICSGFRQAVNLRNALDHAVTCGGPDGYDVLLFQTGLQKRGRKNPSKNSNPYRDVCFDYNLLQREAQRMATAQEEASNFFYALRSRNRAGEQFPGDPC